MYVYIHCANGCSYVPLNKTILPGQSIYFEGKNKYLYNLSISSLNLCIIWPRVLLALGRKKEKEKKRKGAFEKKRIIQ